MAFCASAYLMLMFSFRVVKFKDLNTFVKEKTKNVECHVLYCGLDLRYLPEVYMKM